METSIEWTKTRGPDGTWHPGYTLNTWSGCQRVSEGCRFCYAEALPPKMRRGAAWGPNAPRVLASAEYLQQPYAWAARARKLGVRLKVFAHSTSDVFEARDDLDEWRGMLFDLIELTPDLDYLLLTKRPQEIMRRVPPRWRAGFPANVWVGVTMEDARAWRERIDHLRAVPAVVRYVSYEPAVDRLWAPSDSIPYAPLKRESVGWRGAVDWIIAGGESGRNARVPNPAWFRQVRDACEVTQTAFLFKQWGEWAPERDFPFLRTELDRLGRAGPPWPWLDLLVIRRATKTRGRPGRLGEIAAEHGVVLDAHGAVGDAFTAALLLRPLMAAAWHAGAFVGPAGAQPRKRWEPAPERPRLDRLEALLRWQRGAALWQERDYARYCRSRGDVSPPRFDWHLLEGETPPAWDTAPQGAPCPTCRELDTARLHFAVETVVLYRGISFRDAAAEVGGAASTLTRLGQGHSPSAGALLSILAWLRAPADRFAVDTPEAP